MIIEKIKKLLQEKPKHGVRMIRKDSDLWLWVKLNRDIDCIDDATSIYTAITKEKIMCPCGSNKHRKLISMKDGLSFCGRAGICSAARKAVSENCIAAAKKWDKNIAKEKRKITNKEKYGIENTGQLPSAKQAHFDLYKDKQAVNEILSKMQNTCLEKYGFVNPLQNPEVNEKRKNTNIEVYGYASPAKNKEVQNKIHETNKNKYGTESPFGSLLIQQKIKKTNMEKYGSEYPLSSTIVREKIAKSIKEKYNRASNKQIHITDEAYEILMDKDKFASLLLAKGRIQTAKKLEAK